MSGGVVISTGQLSESLLHTYIQFTSTVSIISTHHMLGSGQI